MKEFFGTYIYNPLYNLLIWLTAEVPFIDIGLAVILVTLLIKIVLFPLSKGGSRTQMAMKEAKPELDAIKADFKNIKNPTPEDRQEMGKKTLEVYREYGIKPFSSVFTLLIQIPILISLYFILFSGGLPEVNSDILYSFVNAPSTIDMTLFGFIPIAGQSLLLALLAGVMQYIHLSYTIGKIDLSKDGNKFGAVGADFGKTMQIQMKYFLPVLMIVIAYISSILALYFIASSAFSLLQDVIIKKTVTEQTKAQTT